VPGSGGWLQGRVVVEEVSFGSRHIRWAAEQISLSEIATKHRQLCLLGRRLDAFGYHAQL
jgi:hypothetical protein